MTAVQYVGDDGTTYQIEQPGAYSTATAGDLPTATGAEPVFPALWVPRFMSCYPDGTPSGDRILVVCNADNVFFVGGPGGFIFVGAGIYKIAKCYGEERPLI